VWLPLVALASLWFGAPACALGAASVQLHTRFIPDKPGASTTVAFSLEIGDPGGGSPPPPLTDLDFHLPAGMSVLQSELGLATCSETALLAHGLVACSPNSRLGGGSTTVKFKFGPTVNEAHGRVTALLGEAEGAGLPVLIYVEVLHPVFAALVFPSRLTNDAGLFGEQLDTPLPLIPTLPKAPDVSITRLSVTFGPLGLTYYLHRHGKSVPFKPRGLSVPSRCPRSGFPFAATLTFLGGTQVGALSDVPCPRSARTRSRRQAGTSSRRP
jgi:hypothetical protein